MTEAEWLAAADPDVLLDFLLGKTDGGLLAWMGWKGGSRPVMAVRPSRRKLRLYACACCRRIADLMIDERSRSALEMAERHVEGAANDDDLATPRVMARVALEALPEEPLQLPLAVAPAAHTSLIRAHLWAARAAVEAATPDAVESVVSAAVRAATELGTQPGSEREAAAMIGATVRMTLLRDIFHNPFRSITAEPSWLAWNDGTVRKIAQTIHDEQRYSEMPILADALEEAGCADEDMLTHCRQPGEHVRGCWVVDLLLRRE